MPKNFVIDTNVLIHSNGTALSRFEENNIWIPSIVIEELDNLKERKDKPDTAVSARESIRVLKDCASKGSLLDGVPTEGGGRLFLLVDEIPDITLPKGWSPSKADNLILQSVMGLMQNHANVILVTNDGNLMLKAAILGLKVEEYRSDRVDPATLYTGRTVRHMTDTDFDAFASSCNREWTDAERAKMAAGQGQDPTEPCGLVMDMDTYLMDLKKTDRLSPSNVKQYPGSRKGGPDRDRSSQKPPRILPVTPGLFHEGCEDLEENEYIDLLKWTGNAGFLAQYQDGKLHELVHAKDPIFDLEMQNQGQYFLKEVLLKSYDETPLVCAIGPAGTGKTLLSLAAGLEQAYNQHRYEKVLLCRSNIMLGGKDEDLGFLPGTEREKLSPLNRAAEDAIHVLFRGQKPEDMMEELLERGVLDMQAVAYLRGRSIQNTFLILDEAQNCTPMEMLSIISRIGIGSKIVVLGDPQQIDNPHLTRRNNGLVYTIDRMAGCPLCDIVTFLESECRRSELSKVAAQRMNR